MLITLSFSVHVELCYRIVSCRSLYLKQRLSMIQNKCIQGPRRPGHFKRRILYTKSLCMQHAAYFRQELASRA